METGERGGLVGTGERRAGGDRGEKGWWGREGRRRERP